MNDKERFEELRAVLLEALQVYPVGDTRRNMAFDALRLVNEIIEASK